jgi:hypothetical protein
MSEQQGFAKYFEGGDQITPFTATMVAEGATSDSAQNQLRAWSYLCGTGLGFQLQGWFGRTITELVQRGFLAEDGTILNNDV